MSIRIKFRRGTAAQWTAANPVLAEGEPGIETDTGKEKRGNGSSAWNALPYVGGAGNVLAVVGSTAGNTGTIVFSNSNGIGFGLNGATITASHNGLTTAAQSNHSHGNPTLSLTNISGSTASGSNGLTLSLAVGNYITTARASNDAVGLNTALTGNGVAWTVNSSGVSLSVPAFLTTAMDSNQTSNFMSTAERSNYFQTSNNTFANSTHSHGNPTLNLTNIAGTTASGSNGLTFSLSAGNYITTAMASELTSNYMSTAERGNYMGTSERGNYFYASNNTFADSTHSHGNPTLALTNINGTTASASNGLTISLSAAGGAGDGINVVQMGAGGNSAGATYSASAGTIHLFGGANITLSQNNNSISVSAAAPGGGAGMLFMSSGNVPLCNTSHSSLGQNSVWFAPFRITGGSLSASTARFAQSFTGTITSAGTYQFGQTMDWALFSAVNSTSFATFISGQITLNIWASGTSSNSWAYQGTTSSSAASNLLITQFMGLRYHQVTINSTLTPNDYLFGIRVSSSTAGYSAMVRTANHVIVNPQPVAMNSIGSQTNVTIGLGQAARYTATSNGMPATIDPVAALRVSNNVVPYIKIGAVQ